MSTNILDLNNDILNIIFEYVKKDNLQEKLMNKILDVVEETKQHNITDEKNITDRQYKSIIDSLIKINK